MKCPLVCVELKTTFQGFASACLTMQLNEIVTETVCRNCLIGKSIKAGKRPKKLPDGLTFFRKDEMPKNWKSLPIKACKKLPYGVNRKRGKSKYPFYSMQIKEVIFLPYEKRRTIQTVLQNFSNKTGWKFVTQKEGDKLRIERII